MRCKNCAPHELCVIPDTYQEYTVDRFGGVYGEYAMMAEIHAHGPIACGVAATDELDAYTGGIFHDKTGAMQTNHDISVVGWGVSDDNVKYWIVRNSWGTHWGEEGFFRIVRGINNIAIESNCTWAHPVDTWTTPKMHVTTADEKADLKNNYTNNVYPVGPPHLASEPTFLTHKPKVGCRNAKSVWSAAPPAIPAEKQEILNYWKAHMPDVLDWRNVNGTNFLSWTKNQHVPYYCGSCWAQGITSMLADRFQVMMIQQMGKVPTSPIGLSAQVLIDCNHNDYNYGCNGGDPYAAIEYIYENGVPHVSCQQYVAQNNIAHDEKCTGKFICRDCTPPIPDDRATLYPEYCKEPESYPLYYVDSYGNATNAQEMKEQLAAFGPLGCGIQATD